MTRLLSLLYALVVTPLGVAGRPWSARARELRIDRDAATYWRVSAPYSDLRRPR